MPTGVVARGGAYFVSELTGFPFLTFEYSSARLADRLRAAKDLGGTSLERARRCLAEFLPLDEERTAEGPGLPDVLWASGGERAAA